MKTAQASEHVPGRIPSQERSSSLQYLPPLNVLERTSKLLISLQTSTGRQSLPLGASLMASTNHVLLSWRDIRFSVPSKLDKNDRASLLNEFEEKGRKPVLKGITGVAKPGQVLAIMGASGSGKTSLLNILAQRLALSKGAALRGDVKVNGLPVKAGDFGKFGAFV
mmetsp:Transcript_10840/g.16461  ORF Transcript_10840/g.16461 Transcript_10840/m.16461 type:complete len:166 (-) Transcript_10840:1565-2062(-)